MMAQENHKGRKKKSLINYSAEVPQKKGKREIIPLDAREAKLTLCILN